MYALILVDYNSLDATISYIQRCRKTFDSPEVSHVVIVENGSEDYALDKLTQAYGSWEETFLAGVDQTLYRFFCHDLQIVYCHSGGNIGYAKGNNLGAEIAKALWACPYYIISNNDLEFPKAFDLSTAQKCFLENPEVGVIGPRVRTPAGIEQSPHKWVSAFRRLIAFIWLCAMGNFVSPQRYKHLREKLCEDLCFDAPTGPCGWVSGCFMIVRSTAFHAAGMFDPYTFLYGEEPILSRRMESAGYAVWFCRELEVLHNHAQTTKSALSRLRILELDFRAMWYYYKTYTNTPKAILLVAKWNFALYKGLHRLWNALKKPSSDTTVNG